MTNYEWVATVVKSPITLDYARIMADLLKALAWPLAFVIGLIIFRKQIQPLFDRELKLGPQGIEIGKRAADTQTPAKAAISPLEELKPDQLKPLPGKSRTPALASLEVDLKSNLRAQLESGEIKPGDEIDILISELAQARMLELFARTYASIFGSQLRGLKHLNEHRSATVAEARQLFEEARSSDPDFYGTYTFEQWLSFMVSSHLIAVSDDKITITPVGRDFLVYLTATGRSWDKRG